MKIMAAGEFKARCLRVMEDVRARREPVLITKKGVPIAKLVPADAPVLSPFGCLAEKVEITGDILSPVIDASAWEASK